MPRKKPKLTEKERREQERQKQEEAEREKRHEQERLKEKQAKDEKENALRKVMIDLTTKHFERVQEQVKVYKQNENEEKMWQKYLDPEATPNTEKPSELRTFLHQWELDEERQKKNRIDPRLMLDERSLLSQDVSTVDKRLKKFQEIRKPIGDTFLPRIKQILTINSEINDLLTENGKTLSDRIYNDLKSLQLIFRKQLSKHLDKWSFEILCDIDRDMKLLDPITAEYNYESEFVNQFLWTFREVPLPPNYTKVNFVSMAACKTEFTKSNLMDLANQSLRGLFLKFDHLSDYCSTYKIAIQLCESFDLKNELEYEQNLLMELKLKKLENMKEERRLFEEERQRTAEEGKLTKKAETPTKKGKNEKTKKKKTKKIKKEEEIEEPPIVDDDTIVDVTEEFMAKLKENFSNEKEKLDPVYLDLESDEVNLREMMVLGGVYSFHLLRRPRQTKFIGENFLITLIDEPDILKYENFFYDYIESPKPRLSLMHLKNVKRQSIFPKSTDVREPAEKRRTTLYIQERRTTVINQEFEEEQKRWVSENELNQKNLFELRIKVSDDVFWWEPPSVCRWEPWEESETFKNLSPAMQNFNVNHEKFLEEQQKKLFAAPPVKRDFRKIKRLQDTKLSEVKSVLPSHFLIKDYLLPRMIDDYKFAEEIRDDTEKEIKERENRLKLRKETIERRRLSEELEREKIHRESKGITFHDPKTIEVETQTESELLNGMQENQKRRKTSQIQKTRLPSLLDPSDDSTTSSTTLIAEARSSFIPSFVQVVPQSTPPKFLFSPKRRLRPLEVVKSMDENESLQSIQLNDILSTISDGFDEDTTTLSKFLAHLEDLHEKEKPFFHTDSYIDRFLAQLEAKKAEMNAEEAARKLKELKHQLRMSKLLEASERESTFYRVPKKSIAEVSKSRVWSMIEHKKRRKTKTNKGVSKFVKSKQSREEEKNLKRDSELKRPTSESEIEEEEELTLIPHFPGKWSKKHVHCESFDPVTKIITFKSGCFGNFGLFTSKYVNFPFKNWKIVPNEQEVTVTLEVKYTTVEFKISSKGFKAGIFLKTKSFLTELVPIITDFVPFQQLTTKLKSINVNVFPEPDACYYLPNVHEKLGPLEEHCYKSMSMFCLTHAFKSTCWNRYSDFRTILLESKAVDKEGNFREVLVTPLKSEFVHISQKCSENVCDVDLLFTSNPPHQDL
ncbi:trichohyalin-like [Culicoides brevitarsis]|uniref:trichohyalin-like n=1 Tax=Culicoides brevitarsis TaxID=469753 RepID=UPI00307B394F